MPRRVAPVGQGAKLINLLATRRRRFRLRESCLQRLYGAELAGPGTGRSLVSGRGGSLATINAKLKKLRLPYVQGAIEDLPQPRVSLLWVPQTEGTPNIAANSAAAYFPGNEYVDWVGTDFYSRFPAFAKLERFYAQYPGKPFVFGEWAMWGADTPSFVTQFFGWIKTHTRVRMLLYNQGANPNGPFRLNSHPKARKALRKALRNPRFLASVDP